MTTDDYSVISENTASTVAAQYARKETARDNNYQSEADLEAELIAQLQRQGYEYVQIKSEPALIANLRRQLEKLNGYTFTDNEWERFFAAEIASDSRGIVEKTFTIQSDYIKVLRCDDGTEKNISLINKKDIHANTTQVINQYVPDGGARPNRYDVTILVNGLPLVHIELKRRGVSIKEAFNQINRYGRESFWAGNGLYEYVQLFVISNGTQTKYYSNTVRSGHIKEQGKGKKGTVRTSNSYEFTNYWADEKNNVLTDLTDFTATFFSRHTLLNILTRYCVFTEQKLLLAMRPYQIAATEKVLNRILIAHNNKNFGKREAGGYIWHTTGSGKTLTSFKTAQLATELEFIDKVLFVVDRKDLDYQTMKEYDRFQKGAANGNNSTRELERQLKDANSRIIVTTIQKLTSFVKKFDGHEVYGKEVVIIFDECHRSQFGEMHKAITKKFKKYYLFGFTGTPIFAENMPAGKPFDTTEEVFGERLHTYTIVDAIRDRNVLPFRVAYLSTMREKENIEDEQVYGIEREEALQAPERIKIISSYILDHFDQQTRRAKSYTFSRLANIADVVGARGNAVQEVRRAAYLNGFNSIFAVQSIDYAKLYYTELKRQMPGLPPNKRLKIATIYSYGVNDEAGDGYEDEDSDTTNGLDKSSRDFLDMAIKDYNEQFHTNYDTSAEKFPNYYKDVSQRMKNREIDLLIVVNMFLTGFDATTLNTLWVDKNLRYHGLLQAYSRTNRILNSVKVAGNIVCFRNLEKRTNTALALFGDADAKSTVILRPFKDYYSGYVDEAGKKVKGYKDYVEELLEKFPLGTTITGEKAEKEFIRLFGLVLRFENLLSNFDDFAELNTLLSERDRQDYQSVYLDLADKYRNQSKGAGENINDDIEFEMELVKQIEVNIDYILYLVKLYHDGHCKDKEIEIKIYKAVDSSPDLRDKKELITQFISSLLPDSDVYESWKTFVNEQKRKEYEAIIQEEKLKHDKALEFIKTAFIRGYVPECGMEVNEIMPPLNPFDPNANREGIFHRILDRIKAFFAKFFDIANSDF